MEAAGRELAVVQISISLSSYPGMWLPGCLSHLSDVHFRPLPATVLTYKLINVSEYDFFPSCHE
jgi:hypothetical protein